MHYKIITVIDFTPILMPVTRMDASAVNPIGSIFDSVEPIDPHMNSCVCDRTIS